MLIKFLDSPVVASWFAAGIMILNSIIAIPVVISSLSIEEINLWFLFYSAVALSQAVLFGFNTTLTRFVAYSFNGVRFSQITNITKLKEKSESNKFSPDEFSLLVSFAKFIYLIISIIFFLFIVAIGFVGLSGPIEALTSPEDGWAAWLIIVIVSTLVIYLSYYRLILEGVNEVALVQKVIGIVHLFGLGCILLVLYCSTELVSIVAIYQILTLSCSLIIAFVSKRKVQNLGLVIPNSRYNKALFNLVWGSVWKSGITVLIASSVKHLSAILVAHWFTSGQSAVYQFTKRLFDIIENFVQITFQAKVPYLAGLRGRGDFERLIPELRRIHLLALTVFSIGYLSLLLLGDFILGLIDSNVELGGPWLLLWFSLLVLISRWSAILLAMSNQANHVIEHVNAIIVAVVFFSLLFALQNSFGTLVVPFSAFVSVLVAMIFVIKPAYTNMNIKFWTYERTVTLPFILILMFLNILNVWL